MFDDILNAVKEHFSNNPQVANAIPPEQADAVHQEIANHISNNLPTQSSDQGGMSGMVDNLENSIASGGVLPSAIEGGLISSLASKFGLPPSVTGAIAGALPGLVQKYMANRQRV